MGAAFAKPLSSPRYPPAAAEEAAPLALDGDRVPSGSGVHPSPSAGGTSCSRRRRCCPPPVPAIVALNTIFEIRLPLNGRRMPKQSSIKKVHLQDLSEDRVALRYPSLSQCWQPKPQRPSSQESHLYGCASAVVTGCAQGPFGQRCDGSRKHRKHVITWPGERIRPE